MKIKIALSTTIILISLFLSAKITEIKNMKSILPSITKKTLVVFDIDNTMLETTQTLGSDQWFDHSLENADKTDEKKSYEITKNLWTKIQLKSKMQSVEKTTPELIKNLQNKKIQVIALTARPTEMFDRTRVQLKENNIEIEKIYSAGQKTKGQALVDILNTDFKNFKHVVFIDDKERHVNTVHESLKALKNIKHAEFRYSFADKKVRSFDTIIVQCQLDQFQKDEVLVSDKDCVKKD